MTVSILLPPLQQIKNGYAKQYNPEARVGIFGALDDKGNANSSSDYEIEDGYVGVAENFVRARQAGLLFSEDEDAGDGEDIEDEDGKNDIIEKVAIAAGEGQ